MSEFDRPKDEAEQYAQQHPQQVQEGELRLASGGPAWLARWAVASSMCLGSGRFRGRGHGCLGRGRALSCGREGLAAGRRCCLAVPEWPQDLRWAAGCRLPAQVTSAGYPRRGTLTNDDWFLKPPGKPRSPYLDA